MTDDDLLNVLKSISANQVMTAESISAVREVTLMIVACIVRQPNINAHQFKDDLEAMVEAQYPQGDLIPLPATDLIAAVHQVLRGS